MIDRASSFAPVILHAVRVGVIGSICVGLVACSTVQTETVQLNDRSYLVGVDTVPAIGYATASVVDFEDTSVGDAQRSRKRYETVAVDKLAEVCRKFGKEPSTEGLTDAEIAMFDGSPDGSTWTFGRNCV